MSMMRIGLPLVMAISLIVGAQADPLQKLIPAPRSVKASDAPYYFGENLKVFLTNQPDGNSPSEADRFAASLLQEEATRFAGASVSIKRFPRWKRPRGIVLLRPGRHDRIDKVLAHHDLLPEADVDAEGYTLLADAEGVIVCARTDAGMFYGVQTLRQLLRSEGEGTAYVPGVAIRDWPAMQFRGIQDDVNRGPVPTLDYMKRQVRTAAAFKLNVYSLYLENLFPSKKHAVINPYGGTFAVEELRELVEYARQYHVDIVPQQQTFGHLHYVLRKELYAELGERHHSQILRSGHEATYAFLEEMLEEITPVFPSPWFHIGADETFELGLGHTAKRVEIEGKATVYAEHVRRVYDLMAGQNKRLMFWSEAVVAHPEIVQQIPEDMVAVAWDYLVRENYDLFLKPWSDAGFDVIVAPSTYYGGSLFPDYGQHLLNVQRMARDGQRYNALGMLNTTWDDNGEALFEMGWYGVLFGAAASWQPGESSIDAFHQAFDWAFHRNDRDTTFADVNRDLASINTLVTETAGPRLDSNFFFVDPFSEMGRYAFGFTLELCREMRLRAEGVINSIGANRDLAVQNQQVLDFIVFAAKRIDYVGRKVQVARELRELFVSWMTPAEGEDTTWNVYDMITPYAGRLSDLRDGAMELAQMNRDLWMQIHRPYYWPVNQAKYDRLLQQYLEQNERIVIANQRLARGRKTSPEEAGFVIE